MQKLVGTGLLVAGGAALIFGARSLLAFGQSDSSNLRAELAELKSQVSSLRETTSHRSRDGVLRVTIAPVTSADTQSSPPPRPAPTPETSSAPSAEETPEEAEFRLQEQLGARKATYQRAFEQEPVDPEWSSWAEGAVERAATVDTHGMTGVVTRCKSSMCRIDYHVEDATNGGRALGDCVRHLPWESTAFNTVDMETGAGYAFVARSGFGLPEVERASSSQ